MMGVRKRSREEIRRREHGLSWVRQVWDISTCTSRDTTSIRGTESPAEYTEIPILHVSDEPAVWLLHVCCTYVLLVRAGARHMCIVRMHLS